MLKTELERSKMHKNNSILYAAINYSIDNRINMINTIIRNL